MSKQATLIRCQDNWCVLRLSEPFKYAIKIDGHVFKQKETTYIQGDTNCIFKPCDKNGRTTDDIELQITKKGDSVFDSLVNCGYTVIA